jgi:hypothetical protein
MSTADKAKRKLIGIEIPRDELAFRIAQPCIGATPPPGTNATKALDDMDRMGIVPGMAFGMGESFRRAADQAVLYFHECIKAGTQPS